MRYRLHTLQVADALIVSLLAGGRCVVVCAVIFTCWILGGRTGKILERSMILHSSAGGAYTTNHSHEILGEIHRVLDRDDPGLPEELYRVQLES